MSVQFIDFQNEKYLCKKHSKLNHQYSPKVTWTPMEGVLSYALIFEDPDSLPRPSNFIHWYIPYISPDITQIDELDNKDRSYIISQYCSSLLKKPVWAKFACFQTIYRLPLNHLRILSKFFSLLQKKGKTWNVALQALRASAKCPTKPVVHSRLFVA